MKNLQQVLLAIGIALGSIILIIGGFALSLAEGNVTANLTPTNTLTPTFSLTLQPLTAQVASLTKSPSLTSSLTPSLSFSLSPSLTPSLSQSPTNCPHPSGWLAYIVQSGDTLAKISTRYRTSVAALQQANCLLATTGLIPGMVIYVPPVSTQTPQPCGRPAGWVVYTVQPGDTLFRLSQAFGVSVAELQQANCMGGSTLLHVGQTLNVPPWATHTPTPTIPGIILPTDTPILVPTDTPVPSLPTDTPTHTPAPTDTLIPVEPPTPTWTPLSP